MNRDQKRFAWVASGFGLWVVFLVLLVVFTANPVVVSRPLVALADAVARLRVVAPGPEQAAATFRAEVLECLKGRLEARQIDIQGPSQAAVPGQTYYALLSTRNGLTLLPWAYRLRRRAGEGGRVLVPGSAALLPDTAFVRDQLLEAIQATTGPVSQPAPGATTRSDGG